MEYNELKKQVFSGANLSELINFNKYVSLVSKKNMVDNIMAICIINDSDGFLRIDYTLKNLFKSLYILVNYTDIELDGLYDTENNINSLLAIEFYDFCQQYKVYDYVLKNCECGDFDSFLEEEIAQKIEIENSVAFVLSKVLNNISNKLPSQGELSGVMKELPNILASFNKPTTKKKKTV